MKKFLSIFALLLVFTLVACAPTPEPDVDAENGANGVNGDNGEEVVVAEEGEHPLVLMDRAEEMFPQQINTGAAHVPGTTFYIGLIASSPFPGMIGGGVFHDAELDNIIAQRLGTTTSLMSMNEFYQFGQDGVATFEYDLDAMTMTFHLVQDVYWHDGVPLTLDDLVFAFEIIAHPEYTGPRFSAENQAIRGVADFREGLADTIEGLVLSNNNRTLTMHFDTMSPSMLYFGVWTTPTPRHVFEGIPVGEMAASDPARITPVGWGPFMVEHVVPGESVSMVRNPNFVWGEPVIERLEIQRVDPSLAAEHMQNGTFDLLLPRFPAAEFGDHSSPDNFRYLGTPVGDYQFMAFRLGHWDFENNVNVFSPDRKMAQAGPLFRQAMAYAIDPGFLGETLFHGLRFAPATNVTPNHRALIDMTVPGFPYNPDRARELLDLAGFDQFDDEGFRLDPNGERFTVNWAVRENPLVEGVMVPFFIDSWAAVGVRVELWRGQTHPAVVLWDYLDFDADDDEIDMYEGGWIVGANPNPEGTWGHIWWNPSRYTSPEYDAILDRMSTLATFDPVYMQQVFSDWQWYWQENVPYFPYFWEIMLVAVNNRVTFWDANPFIMGADPRSPWHQAGLSTPQPY